MGRGAALPATRHPHRAQRGTAGGSSSWAQRLALLFANGIFLLLFPPPTDLCASRAKLRTRFYLPRRVLASAIGLVWSAAPNESPGARRKVAALKRKKIRHGAADQHVRRHGAFGTTIMPATRRLFSCDQTAHFYDPLYRRRASWPTAATKRRTLDTRAVILFGVMRTSRPLAPTLPFTPFGRRKKVRHPPPR